MWESSSGKHLSLVIVVILLCSCSRIVRPDRDALSRRDVPEEVVEVVEEVADDVLDDCVPTGDEICDELDNDCDGDVDEDFDLDSDVVNCGVCGYGCAVPNGTPACVGGSCMVDTCVDGYHDLNGGPADGCEYECTASAENESGDDGTCTDELDNDCDGRVDEEDPDCSDCYPELCDTLDNDCDDLVDEDFNLTNDIYNCGACGTACPARLHALPICVFGECTIQCMPGWVNEDLDDLNGCEWICVMDIPDETLCNGTDADCDGLVDEDYVPYTCGEGACEADSVCWRGVEDCEEYLPLSDVDVTCDGVDDDCDGDTDEEFTPTDLCIGYCKDGAACESGVEVCGDPRSSTDEVCDGIDENCNGAIDENYSPYTCGSGGCIRSSTCIGGVEDCITSPASDEVCDGSDNDCDGDIDEVGEPLLCPDPSTAPHLHIGSYECPLCPTSDGSPCAVCVIDTCATDWYDINGVLGDGCECTAESTEDGVTTCTGTTQDLGDFRDSDADNRATITGNLIPEGDVDWYTFRAIDMVDAEGDCDDFHVVIKFLVNPGNEYQMTVYRDGRDYLGVPAPGCTTADCANELVSYSRNMHLFADVTTKPGREGECPCDNTPPFSSRPTGSGPNTCVDDSANFWIKVSRRGSTVSCLNYEIEVSNGYYTTALP